VTDSEYESQSSSEPEANRTMCSGDAKTMQKKQKREEWKQNPTCSSPDMPAYKHFCGVLGINTNTNMTGHLPRK
jgi:hypothetical protein